MIETLRRFTPLKILEYTAKKGLGKGNLGVVISRAGVGKTACLIHIALDGILDGERLVHVSFHDMPEKVEAFYDSIFYELVGVFQFSDADKYKRMIKENRIILSLTSDISEFERIQRSI